MTFDDYQTKARFTAIYPDKDYNISYPTLGLCGEVGEVAEKVKKIIRDKKGEWDINDTLAIEKELGDVLWYIANIACEFRISLEMVAKTNLEKLSSRKERGQLQGSGDDR